MEYRHFILSWLMIKPIFFKKTVCLFVSPHSLLIVMILPQNTEFHSEVNSRLIHSADFGECTAVAQVPRHSLFAVRFRKQAWCGIRNLAEHKSPLDEDYSALCHQFWLLQLQLQTILKKKGKSAKILNYTTLPKISSVLVIYKQMQLSLCHPSHFTILWFLWRSLLVCLYTNKCMCDKREEFLKFLVMLIF